MKKMTLMLLNVLLILWTVNVYAQVTPAPSLMNFQGRLTRPDGTPVANGTYSVRFSLWTALTGGTEKWNQTLSGVTVRNGTFAVLLNVASPADLFNTNLYLEIKIGTAAPLTPRQPLASVPYALKASTVPDGSITSAKIADGTITSADLASGALNNLSWLLGGNSGTNPTNHFLGTSDNQPLNFRVNNRRALRFTPVSSTTADAQTYTGLNALGGLDINTITAGVVGGTVWGGLRVDANDFANSVTDIGGTVSGGASNRAGNNSGTLIDAYFATVGGGEFNTAGGIFSSVGGGAGNFSTGNFSTIPGGNANSAEGFGSFAAGTLAKAHHDGAFVWSDSAIHPSVDSTAPHQFLIRAEGGVGIGTNAPGAMTHIAGGPIWTSNGWSKSFAINNAAALELGYGNTNRFGLGASGGNLYLFSTPVEDTSVAANYRMVVNGSNGYVGFNLGTTSPYPVTVNTPNGGYGFVQTAGATTVGTWANSTAGWFGTRSNHPLYFFVNDGGPSMSISSGGTYPITLNQHTEVAGRLYAHTSGDAMLGFSNSGYGVWGSSSTNDAIHGISDTGTGVFGYSRTGWAVFSNGPAGGYSGWNNISDARYKQNVATFDNALDTIQNLRGVTFDWNRDQFPQANMPTGRQIGFIAQEIEKVLPELVTTDSKGYKSVAYASVVPVLVEAVKTLKKQNDHKDAEIADLKAKYEALAAAIRDLQSRSQTRP